MIKRILFITFFLLYILTFGWAIISIVKDVNAANAAIANGDPTHTSNQPVRSDIYTNTCGNDDGYLIEDTGSKYMYGYPVPNGVVDPAQTLVFSRDLMNGYNWTSYNAEHDAYVGSCKHADYGAPYTFVIYY